MGSRTTADHWHNRTKVWSWYARVQFTLNSYSYSYINFYVQILDRSLGAQPVALRHRCVECGVVWRWIHDPQLNVVDRKTWRGTTNRMRTGTSQSANIGLTDCPTVTRPRWFSVSVQCYVTFQLVHGLQSVTCQLGSEKTDASSSLVSTGNEFHRHLQRTHTDNTVHIKTNKPTL